MNNSVIKRINTNEKRLDNIKKCLDNMLQDTATFLNLKKDLVGINKYYGSKEWFKDREFYDKERLSIKAGVLSEDGIWNTLEELEELKIELEKVINQIDSLNK